MDTPSSIPGFADPFSSLSHLGGAIVFLALSPALVLRGRGNRWRVATLGLFCAGAVALLSISGTYHLLPADAVSRKVLMRIDHASIFFFIACSFTPIHAILFRGVGRWGMLLLIWTIGLAALTIKTIYFRELPPAVGLGLYLGMGWMGLGTGIALWRRYGFQFVETVLWGGISYSAGALLDAFKWPVVWPGVIHGHEVFHMTVLLGIALHWSFVHAIADGRLSDASIGSPPPRLLRNTTSQ